MFEKGGVKASTLTPPKREQKEKKQKEKLEEMGMNIRSK